MDGEFGRVGDRTGLRRREVLAGLGTGLATPVRGEVQSASTRIDEVDRADVRLSDGRARRQLDDTVDALLAMDEEALLRPFRQRADLPTAGPGLGGWYDWSARSDPPRDMTGFIPGHALGQYVSALARAYAATGDARAGAKARRLVAGLAPTLGSDFFRDYPLPAYTFDKTLVGLLDSHALAGDGQALRMVTAAWDQVAPYLPARAQDRQLVKVPPGRGPAFGWDETYTLPENLFLAAAAGAGDRFAARARAYLLDETYFDPLADGRNVLPGRHAYSHVNALSSALRAYLVDGGVRHLAAARNGMGFVLAQSFATGGWGPNEAFVVPGEGGLGRSLATTHAGFEAPCGTYGHFKVARALIRATGDSRWGDGMERLLYNAALGVLPLRPDGTAFYYADYNDVGARTYYEQACPCCSGSIGQLTADYGLNAFLRDAHGLFVNLYLPARATWRQPRGPAVEVEVATRYPLDDAVRLVVRAERPTAMALRLRIPAWAGPGTRLTVNGREAGTPRPGAFATVARTWTTGDAVLLLIDRPLRAEAVDERAPDRVAMVQGPLALFAAGHRFQPWRGGDLARLRQAGPGQDRWTVPSADGEFRPFFAVGDAPTRLYQALIPPRAA